MREGHSSTDQYIFKKPKVKLTAWSFLFCILLLKIKRDWKDECGLCSKMVNGVMCGTGDGQRRLYHLYQMLTHIEKDGTGASRTGSCSTEATSSLPAEGFTKCAHGGDTWGKKEKWIMGTAIFWREKL